jgi:hypothetical protein
MRLSRRRRRGGTQRSRISVNMPHDKLTTATPCLFLRRELAHPAMRQAAA